MGTCSYCHQSKNSIEANLTKEYLQSGINFNKPNFNFIESLRIIKLQRYIRSFLSKVKITKQTIISDDCESDLIKKKYKSRKSKNLTNGFHSRLSFYNYIESFKETMDNSINNKEIFVDNFNFDNNTGKYTGYLLNNLRHGYGKIVWNDNSAYEGDWFEDNAHGKGIFYHNTGEIYDGEWKYSKANGKGIYILPDGTKYQGDWKDDYQEGLGIETYNDGTIYIGNFKNGEKEGYGKISISNGNYYEGEWKNNHIHGKGKYHWKLSNTDNMEYKGEFQFSKMHGQGIYTWNEVKSGVNKVKIYCGDYKNNLKDGIGCYKYSNGSKFVGDWNNGYQHGYGYLFKYSKKSNESENFSKFENSNISLTKTNDSNIYNIIYGLWSIGKLIHVLNENDVKNFKSKFEFYDSYIANIFELY